MSKKDDKIRGKRYSRLTILINIFLISCMLLTGTLIIKFVVEFKPIEKEQPMERIEPRERDDLDRWLDHLAAHENCPDEGMDDMGSKSYGDLCFKESTFKEAIDHLGIYQDREVLEIISDKKINREVARAMILKFDNYYMKWENTIPKVGLPPEVKTKEYVKQR